MREYADEIGRTEPIDICFHPFSLTDTYDADAVRDEARRARSVSV